MAKTCNQDSVLGSNGSRLVRWGGVELLGVMICLFSMAPPDALAQFPLGSGITYDGYLLNNAGNPLTGTVDFTFTLFNKPVNGDSVAPVIGINNVSVVDGHYSVILDFGTSPFAGDARWLQVAADGAILTPRVELMASPYAFHALFAKDAGTLDGLDSTHFKNAANLTSGILSDLRLSSNVPRRNAVNTFTAANNTFNGGLVVDQDLKVGGVLVLADYAQLLTVDDDLELWLDDDLAFALQPRVFSGITNYEGINVLTGLSNITSGVTMATISGGGGIVGEATYPNTVTDHGGTIGGGYANLAGDAVGTVEDAVAATVGGGFGNQAIGQYSTIGGGLTNHAFDEAATVAGGYGNSAVGARSTIAGGQFSIANSRHTSVGGGFSNTADLDASTCAGGEFNAALGAHSSVGGGKENVALGSFSSVPGGLQNRADGDKSLAAGSGAQALHPGSFVWSDASSTSAFASTGSNQFLIRASNVGIGTNAPAGFKLAVNGSAAKTGGGSWSVFSDARLKENIQRLPAGTLDRVLALRGRTFEYTDEAVEQRLALRGTQTGFIAQEVEEVFPEWVSEDSDGYKYITEYGTTALLVEALRELREEKDRQVAELASIIRDQEARLEALQRQVDSLQRERSRSTNRARSHAAHSGS